jgi:hypothetical protein
MNDQMSQRKYQLNTAIRSLKRYLRKSYIVPGIVLAVFIFLVGFIIFTTLGSVPQIVAGEDEKVQLAKPLASQLINKELQFPLKDAKNKEVSKIRYIIESAEVRDELIVKGKKARAVEGRTFLVLKLKIINTFNQSIQVNARDYIRLTMNKNVADKFAADIHSDPVEVQPDSTKQSRLAFPMNEDDKDLVLFIGELSGKKEEFKLSLKK